MKYRNSELVGIMNFLSRYDNKKLPQKISYAIIKNKILFSKEYSVYDEALKKIFDNYKDKFVLGENGQPVINEQGIPVVSSDVKKEFENEILELLQIEVEIAPYTIPESHFDYEDTKGIYDVLTPTEIFMLIEVLCPKEEKGDTK